MPKRPPRLAPIAVASRTEAPAALAARPGTESTIFTRVVAILEGARCGVVLSINGHMILAYWQVGREIVEEHQRGEGRAGYGETVMRSLSEQLTDRYREGYSKRNLEYMRAFYLAYPDRRPEIVQAIAQSQIQEVTGAELVDPAPRSGFMAELSWGHYRALSKVPSLHERSFYEIEAVTARWSVTDLERQIHTHLYHRLLKSRGKAGVADLAERGHAVERPADVLRAPYVLDFLGIPDGVPLHESDLESAIMDKLQAFILELGKGFAFLARQKRLEYDDQAYYVDLVFYNCILKCYLLIDLKIGKLTHQDVGQMDGYVRLYDDRYTHPGDKPTIGLILCADKSEAVARYSVLHESEQVFAAEYLTYLPTVEQLQVEIQRERRLIEAQLREGGK